VPGLPSVTVPGIPGLPTSLSVPSLPHLPGSTSGPLVSLPPVGPLDPCVPGIVNC
jgi:hypothetical protein